MVDVDQKILEHSIHWKHGTQFRKWIQSRLEIVKEIRAHKRTYTGFCVELQKFLLSWDLYVCMCIRGTTQPSYVIPTFSSFSLRDRVGKELHVIIFTL
jgi:hypothetical protein